MKPKQVMLIAGEASGDILAAELVDALRHELIAAEVSYTLDLQPLQTGLEPRFFGVGGPRMKASGVEVAVEMTEHSVIGPADVLRKIPKFRRLFKQAFHMAVDRQPDVIVCVDYSDFNRRFAKAIRQHTRRRLDWFHPWNPKLIKYVSPQVWASREHRAYEQARDFNLLLSIFPFEKEWYAKRVPGFPVEFVGHPLVERFQTRVANSASANTTPQLLLLPGSRRNELARHLPVMLGALKLIQARHPSVRAKMVLPNESLAELARSCGAANLDIQVGGLPEALAQTTVAIAKTGTITMECAYFGVPAVTMYKTSWLTYQVFKRIVKVKWLTMPNVMANEEIFREFIQHAATPETIAQAALELLQDEPRRARIKKRLAELIPSLGGPGASRRAAQAIVRLLQGKTVGNSVGTSNIEHRTPNIK